jgi:hypothetical protein
MISPQAIEEGVLSLLCFSDEQAVILALKITDEHLFTNRTNKLIAQQALDYIRKYSKAPKQAIEYLLEDSLVRGEEGKLLRQELDILVKQASQVDAIFIHSELDDFIERQKLTYSLQASLELLQQGDLDKAKERIYQASSLPMSNGNSGLWMKDSSQALSFFDIDENAEFFSSGVDVLDIRGVRPERKTLTLFIGAKGKGKSHFLVQVGKTALQHHKKVLHITLEMSDKKTARRYIQSIFSLTRDQVNQIRVPYFTKDENNVTQINFRDLQRDSLFNKKDEIRNRMEQWRSCPQWLIKEFPTGSLSTQHLALFMDGLEKEKKFRPDILLIDYADLMKIDREALRIDTGRLFIDLRGLAVSRDFALVTASQGNRDSDDAKLVGKKNVAEDWSKVCTADTVLTYSQTPQERILGLARLLAAAAREAEDQFQVLISQNYKLCQFCLDSVPFSLDLSNQISALQA